MSNSKKMQKIIRVEVANALKELLPAFTKIISEHIESTIESRIPLNESNQINTGQSSQNPIAKILAETKGFSQKEYLGMIGDNDMSFNSSRVTPGINPLENQGFMNNSVGNKIEVQGADASLDKIFNRNYTDLVKAWDKKKA
jgi:hypothetical protein